MKAIGYRGVLFIMMGVLAGAAPALAGDAERNAEIDNLKQRIEALEAAKAGAPAEDPPFSLLAASKYLTFSGLLELEATYTDGEDDSSDLTLATFEFTTEVKINEQVGGHVTLLYEEEDPDDKSLKVDEAVITLRCPKPLAGQTPVFHGGKMYVPFGKFNSSMITDPLTLDLGETNDTAALFALEGESWTLSLGVFNGGTDANDDDDHIDSVVAALEITPVENLTFGVSYLSDLAESDNDLVWDSALYSDSVAGAAAFVSATFGPVGFEAEFLGALDDFDADLVGGDSDLTGKKPQAWNLEINWAPVEGLQLTGRYEQAEDFQDDVKRYGASGSYDLCSHTVLALEYLHADPDTDPDSDIVTAQLAFEF